MLVLVVLLCASALLPAAHGLKLFRSSKNANYRTLRDGRNGSSWALVQATLVADAPTTPAAFPEKPIPSMSELLAFGLPTMAIYLLQPVLSLIDTSMIGLSKGSSVSDLAALAQGIAFVDSTTYETALLSVRVHQTPTIC
jgi:hypothetical protein